MVSPLWKACSEGQLDTVVQLLADATTVDIELKDHTGVTPLIESVRNGHIDIVKALLDKGADLTNASSQGRPDQYTSDPTILELLRNAQNKSAPNGVSSNQPPFNPDGTQDSEKQFYGPDGFSYYPSINPSIPPVNENGAYYPPAHPQHPVEGLPTNGIGNLPPPEIARLIPCRYFPACRYGAQCMFAHPQTPYFQGPMPPVQYPPFDPSPYGPQYYPSPPQFQQPPNLHPMSPMSPPLGPHIMHARTPSEVVSPAPFSPNGAPHPPPPVPYAGPIYPHPGQMPVPMGMPPIPPIHHSPTSHTHPGPQSPHNYPTSPVPPFPLPQDGAVPYPPVQPVPGSYSESNGLPKPDLPRGEHFAPHPNHRESGHIRRNAPRRPSFGARKPPCLFFPAGRCKNGDNCRFPHVLNDNMGTPHPPSFPVIRIPPRPRGQVNGHIPPLEVKINNSNIREEQPRQKNGDTSSRSQSSDGGHRKFPNAGKHHSNVNGHNHNHRKGLHSKPTQRLPNADDFPVLAGTTTPPKLINGMTNGLTAAQVLQAPPPARRESKEPSTRGASPDLARSTSSQDAKPEVNGINGVNGVSGEEAPVNGIENAAPAAISAPVAAAPKPAVMSFAAAAANSANNNNHASSAANSDVSKEVSVSA
ncbi:hypothetical protein BJ165DRAFT_1522469 [Panaeolus papilionaceus]|nr:hypothetical protein BJ165DRAFT_1522469 [Panaeolus papilionaceus]